MPEVLEMPPTGASRLSSQSTRQQKGSQFLNSSKHSDSVSCQSTYEPCTPAQINGTKALLKHAGHIQSSTSRKISQKLKSNLHARWRINSSTPYSSNPSAYGQNGLSSYSAALAGNSNLDRSGQLNGHSFKHRSTRAGCTACALLKDVEETNTQKLSRPDYILSSKPLFEAMNGEGCWWDAEILQSIDEKHLVHYVHFDSDEDEEVFSHQLRLRSRKAIPWDCFHHLQPGVDITVFSDHPQAFERLGDIRPFAAWYDARIISIYKKIHNPDCVCKFVVQFYSSSINDQNGDGNRTLLTNHKRTVGIKKIGILQKPLKSSFGDILVKLSCLKGALPKLRWSSDAWSLKSQYAASEDENQMFAVELGNLSSKDEPSAGNGSRQSMPDCGGSSQQSKPSSQSSELDFASYLETVLETDVKVDKETSSSRVEVSGFEIKHNGASLRGTLKRSTNQNTTFSKFVSPTVKHKVIADKVEPGSIKEGHVKRKNVSPEENNLAISKPDTWISSPQEENDDGLTSKPQHAVQPNIEMTKEMRMLGKRKMVSDNNRADNKDKMKTNSVRSGKAKILRRKREENANAELEQWCNALFNGDLLHVRDHWRRKESKSELPPKKDQRDAHFLWSSSIEDGLLDSQNTGIEADAKYGDIWQEMQIALYKPAEILTKADKEIALHLTENLTDQAGCKNEHSFLFDEEAGLICERCHFIGVEIEHMVPELDVGTSEVRYRKSLSISDDEDGGELSDSLINKLTEPGHRHNEKPLSRILPHLKVQMHKHQKEGFKFLWKNIVGDKLDDSSASMQSETGGCILSHAPGTGKSLLIISFLQSFLGVNPNCKPLIVAPKIMLRPWQREFLKWKVDIPVYILNTEREYRKSMALEEDEFGVVTLRNGARLQGKELGRIVTLAQWLREDSVLLVSYSLFSTLIEHGSSDVASKVSKKICEMLLQSPDLLILDEGHFPRNKDTKIRSALMKVRTKLRILLSGTVFQNNFEELFNTFYLVRPQFVELFSGCIKQQNDEFLEETERILEAAPLSRRLSQRSNSHRVSPKLSQHNSLRYEIREPEKLLSGNEETKDRVPIEVIEIDDSPLEMPCNKGPVSRRKMWRRSSRPLKSSCKSEEEKLKNEVQVLNSGTTVEAKARRLFMKKIGSKFDQSQRDKSLHDGFQTLRKLTDPFVHYYAGEVLQSLPGLHDFSVMLRPTPPQKDLLEKIAKKWDARRSFELEMAVSSVCIHPCLLAELNFEESQTIEIPEVESLRGDPEAGVKTMFVIELLRLCQCTSEKVLVFSEILSPFTLLEQLTEETLGWVKGKETLRLDGKLTLDERQTIIDRINQPTDSARVLFASIKACGEGITLTGASRVVFLHMAWNPSVMKQAVSRAFRLGQKRPVYVYRLVASGTMEEDKYKRTAWKDWLSRSIFVSQSCNEESLNIANKDLPERLQEPQDDANLLYDACHDKVLEKLLEKEKIAKSFQKIKHCSLFSEK